MVRTTTTLVVLAAALFLALTGCGGGGIPERSSSGPETAGSESSSGQGFPVDSLIGVALPQLTSENWAQAQGLFTTGLQDAGFTAEVQFADAGVSEQRDQIQAMVTNGAKVIVVGAVADSQLGTQLQAAKEAGASVIAYDRLVRHTDAVDYYVAYDNFRVGELQGQSLIDGLARKKPDGRYTIELIAGSPDDANSKVFFDGAMSVLQPKIDDGTLEVASGQTDFNQVVTQGWRAENVRERMDTLLSRNYTGTELDGVLAPNDNLARAVISTVKQAGKPVPIVTGQDSEVESVKSIMAGEQYSTVHKDTGALVAETITMVQALQKGEEPPLTDTRSYNNGNKVVPANLLQPVVVTKANAKQVYENDPTLRTITG